MKTKPPHKLMTPYYCVTDANFIPLADTVREQPEDALWAAVVSTGATWEDLQAAGHKVVRIEITIATERTDVDRVLVAARNKYLFENRG